MFPKAIDVTRSGVMFRDVNIGFSGKPVIGFRKPV